MKNETDISNLCGVYKDIAEQLGIDVAHDIYEIMGGLQICFPKKFYNTDYLKKQILKKYKEGKSIKEITKEYKYSERWIRKILKDMK